MTGFKRNAAAGPATEALPSMSARRRRQNDHFPHDRHSLRGFRSLAAANGLPALPLFSARGKGPCRAWIY
ncbi:MAG: hypothetical protein DCC67_04880 [Planctomycetota bacterium]|nr:MAG: hypothetical protein DCC67_04880 [Planctomycetota bacterium]